MKSLIAIATLLIALPSYAQLTGLMLEEWCSDEKAQEYSLCAGYFAGYDDASNVWRNLAEEAEKKHGAMFCTRGANREVLQRVWLKYIEENPEKLEMPPRWSLAWALNEAYPCDD